MKINRYELLLALTLLPLTASGQIYTYTTPDGVVTFSDRLPPAGTAYQLWTGRVPRPPIRPANLASADRPPLALGMTAAAVREAWGHPQRINRQVTQWGETEQWIYPELNRNRYVYLTNGVVSALQD